MAVTPKGIVTPDPSSPYNLITDLNTLASTADAAISNASNMLKGTASQRASALAGSADGVLWQDTDGIKMIWRKDGAAWVPAITRWSGTTAQMNSFTQAPDGFEWFNSSDSQAYVRLSSAWGLVTGMLGYKATVGTSSISTAGSSLTTVTGAAATYVDVTVDRVTRIKTTTVSNPKISSGAVQVAANLSGATTLNRGLDAPGCGKTVQADMSISSIMIDTIQPGTTRISLAARVSTGTQSIANPIVIVEAV